MQWFIRLRANKHCVRASPLVFYDEKSRPAQVSLDDVVEEDGEGLFGLDDEEMTLPLWRILSLPES